MKCENCTKYDDCRTGSGLTWPCGAYRPKTGSMMGIEKLIEQLRDKGCEDCPHRDTCRDDDTAECVIRLNAATALSTLQDENAEMQKQLNEFSEFLCRMTGNLLSKTNYTAQAMIEAAEDYQQRVCDDCDLRAELEQMERCIEIVENQRDAAIYDMTALMAGQCCDLCAVEYCSDRHKTVMCTAFKWRGPQKED